MLNPRAELVRIKTDLLGYINIDTEIDTNDTKWGEVKREWLPPKPNEICDVSKLTRTNTYQHINKDWNIYEREILDDDDIKSIIKYGGLLHGKGGCGKSTTLDKIKKTLPENSFITGAFTHVASENVEGDTLHSIFGIDVKTKKINYKLLKSYKNGGITHFIIDEVGMIASWIWNLIAHIMREYGFVIIGAGHWGQLEPLKEEHIDFENSWIVKYVFNHRFYHLVKVHRFSDKNLLRDTDTIDDGGKMDFYTYGSIEYPYALCHTNDAVDAINKK